MKLRGKTKNKKEFQEEIIQLQERISDLEKKSEISSKADSDFLKALIQNEVIHYFTFTDSINLLQFYHNSNQFFKLNESANLDEFLQVVHSEDKDSLKNFLLQDINEIVDKSILFRVVMQEKDQKEVTFYSATLSNHKISNLPPEAKFISFHDVSKETKFKKEISRNKEKAEEADKLKNAFLSKISQFIRTPMNSIAGFAEILTLYDPGEKQRNEFLDIIKRQSKTLLDIINDVSEIAMYASGKVNINKTNIDANLVLNELLLSLNTDKNDNRKNKLEIKTKLPLNELKIHADSGRIQQVVINICHYLLKRLDKGIVTIGYTPVEDQKITFNIKVPDLFLDKEEQKVFFNQYLRHTENDLSKYDEAGIGLTIAKIVVKAMNGKIWIESDEEQGTTFLFNIPFEQQVEQDTSPEEFKQIEFEKHYDWRDKVVLIVDDEEVNALFLEAVLQNTQAKTIYAKSGYEAVELCSKMNQIDIVLMDILMPGMNGMRTVQEIRKFNTSMPIIAQTALSEDVDHENCLKVGCNDTIMKPIEVELLLFKMSKYMAD